MNRFFILSVSLFITIFSCNSNDKKLEYNNGNAPEKSLMENVTRLRNAVNKDIIISHRGSLYWAPEETEAAFRFSRNMGTDYLEFDIQMTKDSFLVAFHDNDLKRTSNIEEVFPEKTESGINDLTLKELRTLDIGSWHYEENPDRAKKGFESLKILTLEDIAMIAEGYRIKSIDGTPQQEIIDGEWTGAYLYEKDPGDNGNRPGLYIETKSPKAGVEKRLSEELKNLGWDINNNPTQIKTLKGKIQIANTDARIIFQSFSRESIIKIDQYFPGVPKCLLLWHPKLEGDLKTSYKDAIDFALLNHVQIIGPSIAGEPNNYGELCAEWMTGLIHESGLLVHPYTFDTEQQFEEYIERIDGVFTNRVDLALHYYGRKSDRSPEECLIYLGYH